MNLAGSAKFGCNRTIFTLAIYEYQSISIIIGLRNFVKISCIWTDIYGIKSSGDSKTYLYRCIGTRVYIEPILSIFGIVTRKISHIH